MRNFKEQRNFKRINYKCMTNFFTVNGTEKLDKVEIVDISESGVRLNVPKRLSPKDKVTFQFSIGSLKLTCNATIIWCDANINNGFSSGCKFDVLATNKRLLKLIIEEFYHNNFIYVYKENNTFIIENFNCSLDIDVSSIDRLFQYSSWLLGSIDKKNTFNYEIFKNLTNRLQEYGNEQLDYFNISIYEYDEFKEILDYSISSLYNDNLNIQAIKLEDLDISKLKDSRAINLRNKFNSLDPDIKLEAIRKISKHLLNSK